MSIDPLVMARQGFGRNGIDEDAGPPPVSAEAAVAIRPATSPAARSLAGLGMRPGTPEYAARMPAPEVSEVVAAEAILNAQGQPMAVVETNQAPAAVGSRRVAIYTPRQPGVFSVQIEEAPDWDTVEAFRIPEESTVHLVRVLRALGVKIQDKTGGDLVEAQQTYEHREGKSHRKQAAPRARKGDGGGRRGDPEGTPEDQWSGIAAEIGALDEPAGLGPTPDGSDGG